MIPTLEQPVLTTWDDFLKLPDPEDEASHYELHDGELVLVPTAKSIHLFIQRMMARWINAMAKGQGDGLTEFPYRPAANLQYWVADVAYVRNEDWAVIRASDYPVYAPPLVVEALSPSNGRGKIERQRLAAFAGGTLEFWVIDPNVRTIEVSIPGKPSRIYNIDDDVPLSIIPDAILLARKVFEE